MPIVLQLKTSDPSLGEAKTQRMEVASRLTIGRGADNELVLPDPERQLSKNHCVITFDGNAGWIVDTSTNGVFINENPDRLPRDVPTPLAEGNVLRLGGYQITVAAVSPAISTGSLNGEGSTRSAHDDGPFGDPLASPPTTSMRARGEGALGPVIPEDFDLFGLKDNPPKWQGPSQPDHTPAEQVFFTPPRVTREKIPDDWDLSSSSGGARTVELRPAQPDLVEPARDLPRPLPIGGVREISPDAGINAFLKAVGLSGTALSESERLRVMQVAGDVLVAMIKGLSEILASRASTKQEFRIERTMIEAARNNPLKFADSPSEAMRALLLGRMQGFLSGREAVDQAIGDIKSHELAMVAGMQMALATVIARFDPRQLEKRLDQRSLIEGILPAARKARNWELFTALYKEIATELEEDFQKAFGAEFARAYSKQTERL
jgi:type VI secretion system protein